ncbi:MAG: hypothetical protein ABIJ81_04405 [Patescibacteria group bacterium]
MIKYLKNIINNYQVKRLKKRIHDRTMMQLFNNIVYVKMGCPTKAVEENKKIAIEIDALNNKIVNLTA